MFLNSNLDTMFSVSGKTKIQFIRCWKSIFQNSGFEILYYDHALVYSIRLHGSNTDRSISGHAGGPHWPEQDAQIDIAWIVGED